MNVIDPFLSHPSDHIQEFAEDDDYIILDKCSTDTDIHAIQARLYNLGPHGEELESCLAKGSFMQECNNLTVCEFHKNYFRQLSNCDGRLIARFVYTYKPGRLISILSCICHNKKVNSTIKKKQTISKVH